MMSMQGHVETQQPKFWVFVAVHSLFFSVTWYHGAPWYNRKIQLPLNLHTLQKIPSLHIEVGAVICVKLVHWVHLCLKQTVWWKIDDGHSLWNCTHRLQPSTEISEKRAVCLWFAILGVKLQANTHCTQIPIAQTPTVEWGACWSS